MALRDGGVSLTMGLANGKQEMHIKPARVRFDDHQWHKVTVHRRIQEVCIPKRMPTYNSFHKMVLHVCASQCSCIATQNETDTERERGNV